MWTKKFWQSVAERGLSTLLQAFISAVAVGSAFGGVNWLAVASVAGVATLLSVAKNIVAALATDGSPSIGNVEQLTPPVE